jgi:site-specific DNA-cytosine methylase
VIRSSTAISSSSLGLTDGRTTSKRWRSAMSCWSGTGRRRAATDRIDGRREVVEAAKWGPNRNGETFQWWLGQLDKLGYRTWPLMLNSAAFGVPPVRDRMFVICWRKTTRTSGQSDESSK